jgi:GMP synthase-like glutamine amidotransferase
MRLLSIVHPGDAGTELFAPVIAEAGHRLDEWVVAEHGRPPLEGHDAVLVFGGSMHVDQHDRHPWLRDETEWLRGLMESPVPTLGICLGSQLLALAAGAPVGPLAQPERGWREVELTEQAADDPVLSSLPERFEALQWHHYAHGLPEGAVALARNDACLQAFRLGETTWGVQFHPEVTQPQLERWFADKSDLPTDRERLQAETRERIGAWNELGRRLCRAFLGAAEVRG